MGLLGVISSFRPAERQEDCWVVWLETNRRFGGETGFNHWTSNHAVPVQPTFSGHPSFQHDWGPIHSGHPAFSYMTRDLFFWTPFFQM